MAFQEEPIHYIKSILFDLQGSWILLRESVVNMRPSDIQQRLLFHIDDAMSWESVRDLNQMQKSIVLITNIIQQNCLDESVIEWLEEVRNIFNRVMVRINAVERI